MIGEGEFDSNAPLPPISQIMRKMESQKLKSMAEHKENKRSITGISEIPHHSRAVIITCLLVMNEAAISILCYWCFLPFQTLLSHINYTLLH